TVDPHGWFAAFLLFAIDVDVGVRARAAELAVRLRGAPVLYCLKSSIRRSTRRRVIRRRRLPSSLFPSLLLASGSSSPASSRRPQVRGNEFASSAPFMSLSFFLGHSTTFAAAHQSQFG
uniref:Uncharacterized protein n=3 Tax=Aegilops tauschii subsp. strangulata TaxID=200361 RepID=A0A453LXY2_AEGTS